MQKQILNLINGNLPDIKADAITPLNEGLFAQTWAIGNNYIAKVSKNQPPNDYQNAEDKVLDYLANKTKLVIPKLITHSRLEDGREILIETRVPGKAFSYEEYLRLPDNTKQAIQFQYGRVCSQIHSIKNQQMPGRLKRTAEYQIKCFDSCYTEETRGKLSVEERSIIENAFSVYKDAAKDMVLLPCHADLHFNNIMVSQDNTTITGVIDLGSFQYADPAYEFRYMYGEPQEMLEVGYGKRFDTTFQDRQFFYCLCMFLMGVKQPELSWVSSDQNVKRLKKLIACRHMEEAYR